jgi:endonuclease/exonuclease/phosphatase (EEP) superfamily protein YafD
MSPRRLGRVLLTPVWALVLALLVVVFARVFAFDRFHIFMLLNAYTLWIYLPAYPIAVAALVARAWPLAVVSLLIVVAQLAWVAPTTVHAIAAPDRPSVARIVTANVRFDNDDHAPLIRELESFDADVIVLEEVTPPWWGSIAGSALTKTHPFIAKAIQNDPGSMAILSRRPLTHVVVHRAAGWPIITATVVLGGRAVHLAGIHPVAPLETFERNQRAQRAITAIARGMARPRLLAGDFNATPYNRWYSQLLDLGLRDAHESVGRPFATTWPNGQRFTPPLLLDHVLTDPAIVPVRVREGRGTGSDHRPVVVDLAIRP